MTRPIGIVKAMSSPKTTTRPKATEGGARERLLRAASELFYAEGVHTVGIDRVIERAGVAKASLYNTFGSKDALVTAYLSERAAQRQDALTERVEKEREPRAKILAAFDVVAELVKRPGFRGCAFVNASAEGPPNEESVRGVCTSTRGWTRALFTGLARELGVKEPERVGARLALLYTGAVVTAGMDRDAGAAKDAKALAEVLLDVEAPRRRSRARG